MSADGERQFLHELANQLAIVQGNLMIVLKKWEDPQLRPENLKRVAKAEENARTMTEMLKQRRAILSS